MSSDVVKEQFGAAAAGTSPAALRRGTATSANRKVLDRDGSPSAVASPTHLKLQGVLMDDGDARLPVIARLHYKEAPTTAMKQSPIEDTFVLRAAEGDIEDVVRRLARGQNINTTHSVRIVHVILAAVCKGCTWHDRWHSSWVALGSGCVTDDGCGLFVRVLQRLRCSALHAAAEKGAIDMMRFLIRSGANLNIKQEV